MKGIINLTRWIYALSLLLISILHINLFSLIYTLCFLSIPWSLISSHAFRSKYFFSLALLTFILSCCFISIDISLQILTLTKKSQSLFDTHCSFNVRILEYFGWILWIHTKNEFQLICVRVLHGIVLCKTNKKANLVDNF